MKRKKKKLFSLFHVPLSVDILSFFWSFFKITLKIASSAASLIPALLGHSGSFFPSPLCTLLRWPCAVDRTFKSNSRLIHRLKIGCFSGSLAELFLAPLIAALSVESRFVPAVVSTSRLLLIFNLWAAECTRCFLYFKWVFPVANILMLWCMFAVFQCCFVLYVLCVYCAHFHNLHERPSCQNGILSLHPLWVFLWELGLILNECFL